MINYLNSTAQHWFDWQFAMLWQTAVLIGIVWVIDLAIRKWAWPQVRYALWMLVLVKLLIPPTWTSPASITSHIPAFADKAVQIQLAPNTTARSASAGIDKSAAAQAARSPNAGTDINPAATGMERASCSSPPAKGEHSEGGRGYLSPKTYAMFIWLTGMAGLSLWLIARLTGLRREHLKGDAPFTLPERFYTQLEEVAQKLNLKRLPRVILTDKVACPAVFGVFRPVLLMPAEKLKNMRRQDTEHTLLSSCMNWRTLNAATCSFTPSI